jgi:hypothetical protein
MILWLKELCVKVVMWVKKCSREEAVEYLERNKK